MRALARRGGRLILSLSKPAAVFWPISMKQNTKDWIQYLSAIALIASAIVLVFTSFLTIEEIADGVNTYVGIAISGGLAIFGVAAYFVNQLSTFKAEVRNEIVQQVERLRENEKTTKTNDDADQER